MGAAMKLEMSWTRSGEAGWCVQGRRVVLERVGRACGGKRRVRVWALVSAAMFAWEADFEKEWIRMRWASLVA